MTPASPPEGFGHALAYLTYLRIAWRRRSLLALGTTVGLVLGALYYVQRTPLYESDAQVLVVNKRPDTGTGSGVHLSHFEDYVSTHRVLVRSPLIIERAIEKYRLGSLETFADVKEGLVELIIGQLSVQRGVKESGSAQNSILSLSFRGKVADECAVVVNAVVTSYKEFLDETYRNMSDDTLKLVGDARDTLTKDLAAQEKAYREFREKSPLLFKGRDEINPRHEALMKIENRRSALLLQRANVQGRLDTIEDAMKRGTSRDELTAVISDLTRKSESLDERPEGLVTIEGQLLPLLQEEQNLLGEFGRNHPHIQSVRKRIDATREFFALPSAAYSKSAGVPVKNAAYSAGSDLIELYVRYLKQELQRIDRQEASLSAVFEHESQAVRKLTSYELQDEQFRNSIARTQELCDSIIKRLQDVSFVKDYGGFEARIIAPAGRGAKVAPKALTTFPISLFLGLVGGFGLAIAYEMSDKSFRSAEDVRRRLNLPTIGHIPLQKPAEETVRKAEALGIDPMLCTFYDSMSAPAEAFRGLRTALYFSNHEGHQAIQITSSNMDEGKSTVASNLAVSIAQSGKRVILVDADLRKPRQHKIFNLPNLVGLSAVITGEAELADAVQTTEVADLTVLPAGVSPPNPAELLTSPEFPQLLDVLREKYEYVIVDTAPVLAVSDPCVVAPRVDGVLLVVSVSKNGRSDAERAKEILCGLETKLLGVVVNRINYEASGYGYGYGYGYKGYGYRSYLNPQIASGPPAPTS